MGETGVHISLKAETLFHIGSFPVTNSLFTTVFVLGLLIIGGVLFKKRIAMVPKGLQNLFEYLIEGALELMDSVLGDRRKSEKYLPLMVTIFLFVLLSNWSGLIPEMSDQREASLVTIYWRPNGASARTPALPQRPC